MAPSVIYRGCHAPPRCRNTRVRKRQSVDRNVGGGARTTSRLSRMSGGGNARGVIPAIRQVSTPRDTRLKRRGLGGDGPDPPSDAISGVIGEKGFDIRSGTVRWRSVVDGSWMGRSRYQASNANKNCSGCTYLKGREKAQVEYGTEKRVFLRQNMIRTGKLQAEK